MKRAVKSTAASKIAKRWRCRMGEKVQRLSATHTASAAPPYCTSAEYRFRATQLFRLAPIPDISFRARQACSLADSAVLGQNQQVCFRCPTKTLAAAEARCNQRCNPYSGQMRPETNIFAPEQRSKLKGAVKPPRTTLAARLFDLRLFHY